MRARPISCVVVVALTSLVAAGCASEAGPVATKTRTTATATSTIASTIASSTPSGTPGAMTVIASSPTAFSAPTDPTALLGGFGFPTLWPLPDPLAAGDIVGVSASLGLGSDGLVSRYSTAYRQPAGPRAEAVMKWASTLDAAFGTDIAVTTALVSGTVTGNGLKGAIGGGGSADDPSGKFSLMAIGPEGNDASPVVIEIENEHNDPNGTISYTFPDEITAAIFDLAPCVPETVRAEYDAYDAPNDFVQPPSYTISLDTNCSGASFAAMTTWAKSITAGDGVFVNINDDHLSVSGLVSSGFTVQVSAAIADDATVAVTLTAVAPA